MSKSEHCPAQKVPAFKGSLCEYILQQSWVSAKARKERNASCMYRERALFDGHLFNFSKEPTLIRNGCPDVLINQQRGGGKKVFPQAESFMLTDPVHSDKSTCSSKIYPKQKCMCKPIRVMSLSSLPRRKEKIQGKICLLVYTVV